MSILQTEKLTKIYDKDKIPVHALTDVDLAVEKGDFIAIAGPSGSGKTTLLNLIGALDAPTSGKVILNNKDLSRLPESKLSQIRLFYLGFVFQSYNLIPVLTAFENVEYILLLQGKSKQERVRKVTGMLEELGLGALINKIPSEMSGGQQQRVALARALVSEPKLILADEPTANLDSETARDLLELMKELNEKKSITFIFSTHDKLVMDYAKKLIRLKDGRIISNA